MSASPVRDSAAFLPSPRPARDGLGRLTSTARRGQRRGRRRSSHDGVPSDLLDLVFAELGKTPLLTAEEEVRLAQKIEAGRDAAARLREGANGDAAALEQVVADGRDAFDRFVRANLRLVVRMASQFSRRSRLGLADLIQEGAVGLVQAVDHFDWRRGYRFSTYATWWIRQALQRGSAMGERPIRLPIALHDALVRVRAATLRLEDATGRSPSIDEIAVATNLPVETVRRAMNADSTVVSLDTAVGDDADASTLGEFVAVADDAPDEEVVQRIAIADALTRAEACLDERSWSVLVRRFGLGDHEPSTLEEVAREIGRSRETVRVMINTALARLRSELVDER